MGWDEECAKAIRQDEIHPQMNIINEGTGGARNTEIPDPGPHNTIPSASPFARTAPTAIAWERRYVRRRHRRRA